MKKANWYSSFLTRRVRKSSIYDFSKVWRRMQIFFSSQNVRRISQNGKKQKQEEGENKHKNKKAPCGIGVLRARVYIQPGYCTIILGNWKMRPFKNAVGRWGLGILSL
jgi:hypothetical protein